MLDLVFLLLGFIPLILGANLLVDNASSLAKRLGIPDIVIGLTIIAFGTSAPELVVNVFSSVSGSSAITFGNVVGSNIINILLILGVSSVIYPLRIQTNTVWNEIPLCLLAAFVLVTLAADSFLDGMPKSAVTRVDGIVLLLFFAVFMAYNIQMMKTSTLEDT
ncbi:MAG: sodium:calcium antiporter, partial [Spirochaetota bacterium]